ncbi:hypothetical protein, partial [Burkholderia singularis]|uniref:hypothetical protein n=1 Tax=Burkholderia singularis TaxID=1503053 RepID=UPI00117CDA75
GSISNVAGKIISAGRIVAHAGSLNNASGTIAAKQAIAATVTGDVNNAQGQMRALSSLSLHTGGTLTNANGRIQSGTGGSNDTSTLDLQSASVDNSGGLIGNLGTGATSVQGGSQLVNRHGVVTGNGAVTIGASSIANTQGGEVSGANVKVRGDALDNSGGTLGNIGTIANGDIDIATTGTVTNTGGKIGATRNLSVSANTLLGGGAYSAANDVALNLAGDFTTTPDFQFNAGHDLAFTLPGTFTNGAGLQAVNNL